MHSKRMSRRQFVASCAGVATGLLVAACGPKIVKETVIEEVEVIVKETVEVEKVVKETVEVEKEVVVEVEKEVVVEVAKVSTRQAPMLQEMVKAGELPPLEERLPVEPLMVSVVEEIGKYGGTWQMVTKVVPHSHVYELLQYEPPLRYSMGGLKVLPNVVASWEEEEGKVFTFHLRKGVKWSDGEPLTADDVLFWYEDVIGNEELYPAFPVWLISGGERPKLEKLDDYTVRFTYGTPAPFFIRQMAYPHHEAYRPKHYLKQFHAEYVVKDELDKIVKEKGFDNWAQLFLDQETSDTSTGRPVVFAWDLESYEAEGAVYVRNPYYWKVDPEGNQLPYIDKVETRVAANVEVAQMMAFSAEAELQTFSVGQFPSDTMILKKNAEMGNYHVIDAPISEPNVCVFGLNLTCKDERLREIFRDRRFRIALSHAINREDIRQLIYLGQPKEIRQCAPLRESPFYHEGAAQNYVEYDPDKANSLLDEIGFTDRDAEGYRLLPDGKPIAFAIEIIGKRNDFIDAMEMVAEWWREVGIKATAKATETSLYFTRLRGNELQAGVDYSGNGMFPVLGPYDYIPLTNSAVWAADWGIWYATRGKSGEEPPSEVKRQMELYDEMLTEPNVDKQKGLWAQIMDINAENMYHFGICDRATVPIVCSNKLHNVPETGWNIAWEAGNIGTTNPCQYWKEE